MREWWIEERSGVEERGRVGGEWRCAEAGKRRAQEDGKAQRSRGRIQNKIGGGKEKGILSLLKAGFGQPGRDGIQTRLAAGRRRKITLLKLAFFYIYLHLPSSPRSLLIPARGA